MLRHLRRLLSAVIHFLLVSVFMLCVDVTSIILWRLTKIYKEKFGSEDCLQGVKTNENVQRKESDSQLISKDKLCRICCTVQNVGHLPKWMCVEWILLISSAYRGF